MNVLLISLFALVWIHDTILGDEMGPFEATIISSGRCPPEANGKDLMKYESRLKRTSRTELILLMNISFQIPMDDKLTLKLILAKQTSQGWKDNYFQLALPKVCSAFRDAFPENTEYSTKKITIPIKSNECLPAGNYTIPVRLKHTIEPKYQFFYNRYRGRLTFLLGQDVVFCNEAIIDVLPASHNG